MFNDDICSLDFIKSIVNQINNNIHNGYISNTQNHTDLMMKEKQKKRAALSKEERDI